MRANNVTDTAFIGLDVITAPTNIATAQRAMMTEKTNWMFCIYFCYLICTLNFWFYASARFKDLFLKPFPGWPFLSADFFFELSCPIWVYEPFFTAHINKERGIEKSFGRQKCWGQRSRPALFFSEQRAKTGTLSYPSTEINLPFKNKGSQMELWKTHIRGGRKQGKGQNGK